MSQQVRVESLESMRRLREALLKFEQASRGALSEAESDFQRTRRWLEADQMDHWQRELRLRGRQLEQAREAVRHKTLYKTPSGHTASAVEEKQMLAAAQRRVEEAQHKIRAIKQWQMRLERQIPIYRGALGSIHEVNDATIPNATATLDRLMRAVEAYLAEQPPARRIDPAVQTQAMSMALAALDDSPAEAAPPADDTASDDDDPTPDATDPPPPEQPS